MAIGAFVVRHVAEVVVICGSPPAHAFDLPPLGVTERLFWGREAQEGMKRVGVVASERPNASGGVIPTTPATSLSISTTTPRVRAPADARSLRASIGLN
jgi:hypothetical protein